MAKLCDKMFFNVILLGFAFMLVFTAFQTCGMIQKVVIYSMTQEYADYSGDGYISLAVIYAVFAISNWFAPSIISCIGPKYAMFAGGITYALFILNFLFHMTWALYFASFLIGIGASVIWTGQGNYLTINSDSETMSRNAGVFWALMQCSLLFGNLLVFFQFQGKSVIDEATRISLFTVLLVVCVLGLLLMLCLPSGRPEVLVISPTTHEDTGPRQAFVKAFQMLRTRKMALLSVTFLYTGLELSFFSGVYGPSVGFTKRLGEDAAKYTGICGIFIGAGEIIGGSIFGLLGKKTNKHGRDPIVLLGYLIHMVCFFCTFINLPAESPIGETYDPSYIKANVYLAMFCAFGLGLGDACFNTQVYSILGSLYSDDSAPAFAIFKFFQSIAAAVAFFYSTALILPHQLLILVVIGTIGTVTFWVAEWEAYEEKAREQKLSMMNKSS